MAHHLATLTSRLFQPLVAEIKSDLRMILRNITDVICYRSTNIQLWVVNQLMQQRQNRHRITNKRGQATSPG
jgi:spore maturation protein CgeB